MSSPETAPSGAAAGHYPDPMGIRDQRYWDGESWQPDSDEERRRAVEQTVEEMLAKGGGRVESHTNHQAIVVYGKPVNHVLHLLLSIFTLGFWLLVWILLSILGGEERRLVHCDEYGHVDIRKVRG